MKLTTSLDRGSAGPVLFAPIVDALLIVVVFFLFGSRLAVPVGIPVELPTSTLRLAPLRESHLLVISAQSVSIPVVETPGSESEEKTSQTDRSQRTAVLALDGKTINLNNLDQKLVELRETSDRKVVVLQADRLATHGLVVRVSNAVLEAGFELAYATSQPPAP